MLWEVNGERGKIFVKTEQKKMYIPTLLLTSCCYSAKTLPHPLHQSTRQCCCETSTLSIIDGFRSLGAALTDMLV